MSAISRPVTYVTKVDFAQLDGYGIPDDGLGNLGDRYYDIGAGRWYLKRWVGNFINDTAICPTPVIGGNDDWEATVIFKANIGAVNQRFIAQNNSSYTAGEYNMDQLTSTTTLRIGSTGGFSLFYDNLLDGTWKKIKLWRRSGLHGAEIGGVVKQTSNSITLLSPVNLSFGTGTGGGRSTMSIAGFRGSRLGVDTLLSFEEGTGSVVIDRSNNGNNAIVSDGTPTTFWAQAWVPMDLL